MSQSVTSPADREEAKSFWQAGHNPTLLAAFLYFDVSFMVWVMLGPLAPILSAELGLDPAEKGLMVAVPTLAGTRAPLPGASSKVEGSLAQTTAVTAQQGAMVLENNSFFDGRSFDPDDIEGYIASFA